MKPVFRAASPSDAPKVAAFLRSVFAASPEAAAFSPDLLHWKFWADREGMEGSRSFVLEQEGAILAHGALWPSTVLTPSGAILPAAQVIDWAADSASPGAGLALMKNISKSVDLIFALGGSESTKRILPIFGFRPLNEIQSFAKPLRPIRQILTHQWTNWKSPLRLARNSWWSVSPPSPQPESGWSSRQVEAEEIGIWPAPREGLAVLRRGAPGFRYCSGSGVLKTTLHLVEYNGAQAGYFYLAFVPGLARIADAWAVNADPAAWKQVYALAIRRARQEPGINEITSIAGIECAQRALAACGFRLRQADSLMLYDPRKKLQAPDPLHFQLIDNDAFFRHSGRPEYET